MATLVTSSVCPVNRRCSRPSLTSQSRTVLSSLPLTARTAEGVNDFQPLRVLELLLLRRFVLHLLAHLAGQHVNVNALEVLFDGFRAHLRRKATGVLRHQLAVALKSRTLHDPLVLAIPRGGVVVGAVLAQELNAELDIVLSRKLPAPGPSTCPSRTPSARDGPTTSVRPRSSTRPTRLCLRR